jgi:hypothetical protein
MSGGAAKPPWCARPAVRLTLLLVALAIVSAHGLPRVIARASAGTPAPPCPPRAAPTAKSTLADLGLMASGDGLYSLVRDGTLDTYGLQEPAAAWLDNPPDKPTGMPSLAHVDAGFELRWWSRTSDHFGASLFLFAGARSADEYVSEASSTRCRSGAVSTSVSWPAGARAIVWDNPLGYLQADVYFARGRLVYRLADVASGSADKRPSSANLKRLLVEPERVACELTYAGCVDPGSADLIVTSRPSRLSARRATLG